MNDMRSDFSQSMLFRGETHTHTHMRARRFKCVQQNQHLTRCVCSPGAANTTRIFEGTRIVKTGMVSFTDVKHLSLHVLSSRGQYLRLQSTQMDQSWTF